MLNKKNCLRSNEDKMELLDANFNGDSESKGSESADKTPLKKYFKVPSPSTSQFTSNDSKSLKDVLLERKSKRIPVKKCFRGIDVPKNKRKLLFHRFTIPRYKDYQLLGDSQCIRFAQQILEIHSFPPLTIGSKSRHIGYCVSGQKIEDLECRLSSNNYKVHSKVILMIGTNDLVQKTNICRMCEKYEILLDKLIEKCSKILLVTVPPVPKLKNDIDHWDSLRTFSNVILSKVNNRQIYVIDLCTLFVTYDNKITLDSFERMFYPSHRLDLIHLNLKGLKIMKAALDTHYFNYFDEERNHF